MDLPSGSRDRWIPTLGAGTSPDPSGVGGVAARLEPACLGEDRDYARNVATVPGVCSESATAEQGGKVGGASLGPDGAWRYLQHVSCSDAEMLRPVDVLEVLLHFGGSGPNARSLAAQLFERFGSLGAVVAASSTRLTEALDGDHLSTTLLKAVRAAVKAIVREPLEARPVIGSASGLMDYLSVVMRHETTEVIRILFLDRKNGLIKDEIQHRGTVDHTPLYPREVVRRVIELGASAIILVHNHPSGDPTPTETDIKMTRQLAAALNTINVVLHDHVIVGSNQEISLRKNRVIWSYTKASPSPSLAGSRDLPRLSDQRTVRGDQHE